MLGAGGENRTPISSLEGWHISRYTTPATPHIIPDTTEVPLVVMEEGLALLGLDLVEDLDVGADGIEAFGEVFIAAVNSVHIAQGRETFGGKHTNKQ